ncbi:diguanylate cyclase [Ruminococcus sp. NK3A76]|uniref:sensor domain-containing diguanylate cyclase n=1 Tax=Ruminococcus sp. NK3A76 TaxID=877411 RepID=UPI00048AAF14|nr:diguanylate cyclase [Ruminococcus sp. NK3A76]
MKQFQFNYVNDTSFVRELRKLAQWRKTMITSAVLFQIYSQTVERDKLRKVCDLITQEMPDALYMGCSTNGNILNGEFSKYDIAVTCTVCEYPNTKMALKQFILTPETEVSVTDEVISYVDSNPWVKAVEMLVVIRGLSMTGFCDRLDKLRDDVLVFGGGAFVPDFGDNACAFSSEKGYMDRGVVFLFIGGDDLHIDNTYITGWKPLGRELNVTRAKGVYLNELDNKPAFDTYYRYLNIKNDEHFFTNTLEFPFVYDHNGITILRAPVASLPDGSLEMTADIKENVKARIAYGDPWTILESVRSGAEGIRAFQPEVIHVFSCAARRTFWGEDEVSKETIPFQTLAPTSGFYTSGEFLRSDGHVNQHNVTLVVAAMREGELLGDYNDSFEMKEESFSGKVSMINRLATFIEAATEELEEANAKLAKMAVTDALTGLYNRGEIQRQISSGIKKGNTVSLVMLDLDNFKSVNDTFGHKEGDNVIRGISSIMTDTLASMTENGRAGRWGGEEFMILLENEDANKAEDVAEKIRKTFSEAEFPSCGKRTVSIGLTKVKSGESADAAVMRADNALYEAKDTGKNKVVVY